MSENTEAAEDEHPGRWLCKQPECRQPVEANPVLYMSLTADGTWYISGVEDQETRVVCTEGHDQGSEILEKSMTAFLEEQFPGCTWQGSDPRNHQL